MLEELGEMEGRSNDGVGGFRKSGGGAVGSSAFPFPIGFPFLHQFISFTTKHIIRLSTNESIIK